MNHVQTDLNYVQPLYNKYIPIENHRSLYVLCVCKYKLFFHTFSCTCQFRPCLCYVYTRYIHQMYKVIVFAHVLESKKLPTRGIEPRTSNIASGRLNHCASIDYTILQYIIYFCYLEVGDVRLAQDQPPPPPPP